MPSTSPARPASRRETTHERIVEVAARAVRRQGYAGVGVADVMKQAGLTHGGFYAHFPSRDALLVEAVAHAGRQSAQAMARRIETARARGIHPLQALVDNYLSERHLAGTEHGCAVAALASEMPRQSEALAAASAERVQGLVATVRACLPPEAPQDEAFLIAATLVGSLQLARAAGSAAKGRAMLVAARQALIARHVPTA